MRIKGFVLSTFWVWLAVLIYRNLAYYKTFLSHQTQDALVFIAIIYTIYLILFYSLASISKVEQGKGLLIGRALKKISTDIGAFLKLGPKSYLNPLIRLEKEEKRALLFTIVKLFFIPLMISFLFDNWNALRQSLSDINSWSDAFSLNGFNNLIYPLLFALFLLIDTAFFAFGYLVEAGWLDNKIRSVEPTAIGWAVALMCYAPFNGLITGYINWYPNDYAMFGSARITFIARLVGLIFMGIYASASVALGPKASNLTNRGIVGYGPYKFVRHPAYISKNLAWWITIIPVFSIPAVLSMAAWSSVYFMRAVTEERHLSADPDYLAYCKRTKRRFIPGLV